LKSFFGWASAPQEGAGGMRGGDFKIFGGHGNKKSLQQTVMYVGGIIN